MPELKVKDVLAALTHADPEADFCAFSDFGTVALQHIAVYLGKYQRPLGNKLVLEHVTGQFVGVGNPGNFDTIEVPELLLDLKTVSDAARQSSVAEEKRTKVLSYPDTKSALEWRDDTVANVGDVLLVESEQVVAVASPFDFAVTVKRGQMSEFLIDQPVGLKEFLQLVTSIRCAVAEANKLGYEVVPELLSI